MTSEDDAALSAWEWQTWLEDQPELDVPAGPRDNRLVLVLLADHTHAVEVKLWELLTIRPVEANLNE